VIQEHEFLAIRAAFAGSREEGRPRASPPDSISVVRLAFVAKSGDILASRS